MRIMHFSQLCVRRCPVKIAQNTLRLPKGGHFKITGIGAEMVLQKERFSDVRPFPVRYPAEAGGLFRLMVRKKVYGKCPVKKNPGKIREYLLKKQGRFFSGLFLIHCHQVLKRLKRSLCPVTTRNDDLFALH